jgi:hypothetical protein
LIVNLLLLLALGAGAYALAVKWQLQGGWPPYVGAIVVPLLLNVAAYFLTLRGILKDRGQFFYLFATSIVVRTALSLIYIFVFLYLELVEETAFIALYFLGYFSFTAFEIFSLLANLRSENRGGGDSPASTQERSE